VSSDAEQVVRSFFEMQGRTGQLSSAFDTYMDDLCVWENSGLPSCNDKTECLGMLKTFIDQLSLDTIRIECRTIGTSGSSVLTERVDVLVNTEGAEVGSIPIAGVLEVSNGKIVRWRDYFDPRPLLGEGA
jgi:limonene-1,2-epoxide hydrolase